MKLARRAGFRAVVLSAVWEDGARAGGRPAAASARAVDAAVAAGDRARSSPSTSSVARRPRPGGAVAQFAEYAAALASGLPEVRDVIVGNEPNLNLFWQPQFDDAGGDRPRRRLRALLADDLRRAEGASTPTST